MQLIEPEHGAANRKIMTNWEFSFLYAVIILHTQPGYKDEQGVKDDVQDMAQILTFSPLSEKRNCLQEPA